MNALIDLPFAVPTVVTGLMLVALYGPSSVLGAFLGRHGWAVIYQKPGIVLALLFVTYPFVIRSVQPVLLEMDRAEEEAAATLGAGPWTTFRRVTLPTLWPAILTGTGPVVQPGPGRVRQRGDGRRQPAARDQDRPDVHLRRDRERQPPRRDGRLGRPARLLARHPDRPEPAPAPRRGARPWPLRPDPRPPPGASPRSTPRRRRSAARPPAADRRRSLGWFARPDPGADAGPGPRGAGRAGSGRSRRP